MSRGIRVAFVALALAILIGDLVAYLIWAQQVQFRVVALFTLLIAPMILIASQTRSRFGLVGIALIVVSWCSFLAVAPALIDGRHVSQWDRDTATVKALTELTRRHLEDNAGCPQIEEMGMQDEYVGVRSNPNGCVVYAFCPDKDDDGGRVAIDFTDFAYTPQGRPWNIMVTGRVVLPMTGRYTGPIDGDIVAIISRP